MAQSDTATSIIKARVVLQQCLSARLQVQPQTETSEAKYVEIGRGLVIYLCFLKEATTETADKIVKTALNILLSSNDEEKLVSVLELQGDVLIVPQATLGGTLKGKRMQYHKNIDKESGRYLYERFVKLCSEAVSKHSGKRDESREVRVLHGTYGNRQVLKIDTNGPYTHMLEF
ncbi:D-aminoacyl-tRNA deacylase 2-like [Liolophura sinensis]|uniref:D-aminoacyl-tRNA deacylase 2-like n=1 Tax=Liolophura sinensis TaxID=3198878 RepID=UPI003158BFEA